MQIAAAERLKGRLERLNSPNYSYLKVLFRLIAVYLISFAIGIFGIYLLKIPFSESVNSHILAHFVYAFEGCDSFFDGAFCVLSYSFADIIHLFAVFLLGFTAFASLGACFCFFVRGVVSGLSIGYLLLSLTGGVLEIGHSGASFFGYVLFSVVSATVLTAFSANAVVFSYEYRRMRPRRRKALEFAFTTLVIMGYLIIISLVRCTLSIIYTF